MKIEETITYKTRKPESEAEEFKDKCIRQSYTLLVYPIYDEDDFTIDDSKLNNWLDEHGKLCRKEERDRIKESLELISYNTQLKKYELLDFDDIIEIIDKEGGRR